MSVAAVTVSRLAEFQSACSAASNMSLQGVIKLSATPVVHAYNYPTTRILEEQPSFIKGLIILNCLCSKSISVLNYVN